MLPQGAPGWSRTKSLGETRSLRKETPAYSCLFAKAKVVFLFLRKELKNREGGQNKYEEGNDKGARLLAELRKEQIDKGKGYSKEGFETSLMNRTFQK